MAINGIPIDIRMDTDGKPQKATVFFATVRKSPALLEHVNAVRKTAAAEDAARRTFLRKLRDYNEAADAAAADKAEAECVAAQNVLLKTGEARGKAVADLFAHGMVAAGYTEADVDKYFPFFDPDRYHELVEKCLIGCGRVDFFSETTPAARS